MREIAIAVLLVAVLTAPAAAPTMTIAVWVTRCAVSTDQGNIHKRRDNSLMHIRRNDKKNGIHFFYTLS